MIIKLTLILFVSWANAIPLYQGPVYGTSYVERPEPYSFGFDVKDEYGTSLSRKEQGDELGNKQGTYGYIDAYGIARQVDYVADDKGFRAIVRTNEPGTENQDPANVQIQSDAVKNQILPAYSSSVPAYGRTASSTYGIVPAINQPIRQVYSDPSSLSVSSNSYGPVVDLY